MQHNKQSASLQLEFFVNSTNWILVTLTCCFACLISGCAEGPFWRAGKFSPWAQNHWAAEEKIADTLFVRKRRMAESVDAVINAPVEDQQKVAQQLAEVLHRDPVLLLRLHAVKMLGKLNCPAAVQALVDASHDHTSDIRIEAINAWGGLPAETAIPHLQEMIGSDTEVDVRLAATRALGNFSGQKAVAAISLALDDTNPALQRRAAESLERVTGERLGGNIAAWQKYVESVAPMRTSTKKTPAYDPDRENGFNNMAENDPLDSIFR